MISAHFSQAAPIFRGKEVPGNGVIIGYGAIIAKLDLPVPMPGIISIAAEKSKKHEIDGWQILPKSYAPNDLTTISFTAALYNHLVFALKYEGINLSVFKSLSRKFSVDQLTELVSIEPTGIYSRKIWFLLEWLMATEFPGKEDLSKSKKSYVPLIDPTLQYAIKGNKSPRHLILNNLPGTVNFCPLIRRTAKLEKFISAQLDVKKNNLVGGVHKDTLQRASSFLLLKDSKASFSIEGESPKSKRAARWGQAIGQAGMYDISVDELNRLQQLVIENSRFVEMGFRKKGGFVGEHDRTTGEPIPDHISARWQDLNSLMNGLIETNQLLLGSDMDAVLAASSIAFGFVFIHPFEDGNGRIHRYLIHHVLAKKKFSQQGIIFPVSASILDHIDDYRTVLESYSKPLLDFIEWTETTDHNVEVRNETIDYYRYFDLTAQAEFLYSCVKDTIENIIPKEVSYLIQYDNFKQYLDDELEMPDKTVALLVSFLKQNNGTISKRARDKEFSALSDKEIKDIETKFSEIFSDTNQWFNLKRY